MEFSVPTRIIHEVGALQRIGGIVKSFGVKRVLLCTDHILLDTPAGKLLTKFLHESGVECSIYTELQPEPIDTDCDRGAEYCAANGIELIIAFGGGSVMDQSKAMAAIVTNHKSCRELDNVVIEKRMLPLICIPTTAGTGSEVTFVAVITNTRDNYKMTIMDRDNLSPNVALCDPQVLQTLPPKLVASCGMDALTHSIEAFTSKSSNVITEALSLRAMRLIAANILPAWKNPADLQAQSNLMAASTMAGCAFINSNVGAVHAIAETAGVKYHIPHGTANAIFLPHVMAYNLVGNEVQYAQVAAQLGLERGGMDDGQYARHAVEYVRWLASEIKIDRLINCQGVSESDFEELAQRAAENELSRDNIREIAAADYLKILTDAYQN